ncbi:unnamed protein product [Meganyctiphanes norvegica]|uniref:ZP domain-containing protein n=1 Tax=Meganyctiphanes norvegica TaxID=48144 RepID=A0AAV2R4Y0_MEGNR
MIWALLGLLIYGVVGQDSNYEDDVLPVATGPLIQPSVGINRPGAPPDIQSLASHRQVLDTHVNCGKTFMEVIINFSEDFSGVIYPYLKYDHCLLWHGPRSQEVKMTLQHGICGAEDEMVTVAKPGGIKTTMVDPMIEHHLMIQWDRDMVGEDDMNVIVRCERPSDYNRTVAWSVTAKDKIATETRAEHPGPQMYMDMQVGEGPGAPSLDHSTPVLVGDTLTMLLVLSDEVFWFDSNILNCQAVDGGDQKPQIMWADRTSGSHGPGFGQMPVIENGCSVKKNVFSDFYKEKQTLNNGQMVTTHYAHFKAFRFPTSHKIIVQCNVQVCYEDCPEQPPCSESFHPRVSAERRKRRDLQHQTTKGNEMDRVQLFKTVEVFLPDEGSLQQVRVASVPSMGLPQEQCYSAASYLTTTLILAALVLILAATLAYTCTKMVVSRPTFFSPRK